MYSSYKRKSFPWREQPLERILLKKEFKWRKCTSKGTILIENSELVTPPLQIHCKITRIQAKGINFRCI
jgi:hypothetical protein